MILKTLDNKKTICIIKLYARTEINERGTIK